MRRTESFDDFNVAAHELRRREVEVEEIRRGVREAPPLERTVGDVLDYWLKHRAPKKRSESDDISIIRAHLRPAFGAVALREIGQTHVDAFEAARAHLDKKTVANHLTLLIACLNMARDLRWLLVVPRIRKPKIRLNSTVFRYLRTDGDVARFLASATQEDDPVVEILYRTAIFTGLREGELAGLRWHHVDFERSQITVEMSFKGGPTKSGIVRRVPLFDVLKPSLEAWHAKRKGEIVFPSQAATELAPSGRIFQETLHRVLKRAGFPARLTRTGKERGYVVFHDLRHTFASHWVMKGGDIYKLQRMLGHQNVQMTMRYAHLDASAFAGDMGRFGRLVG